MRKYDVTSGAKKISFIVPHEIANRTGNKIHVKENLKENIKIVPHCLVKGEEFKKR